jgi:hypothetical protein
LGRWSGWANSCIKVSYVDGMSGQLI